MKLYRKSDAPTGALMEVRNVRLYGSQEEQVSGAALRSRGCPSPDRAYVPAKTRQALERERATQDHARRLQRAQTAMLEAQRLVRGSRATNLAPDDRARLADDARRKRAEYLRLTGGVERRTIVAPVPVSR